MGFDIRVYCISIRGGKYHIVDYVERSYLSYNWSPLNSVCWKHLASADKCTAECKPEHLWHIRDDLSNRLGRDVLARLNNALNILAKHNIYPGTPDESNNEWGFGVKFVCYNEKKMPIYENLPIKDQLAVLAFHLENLRNLALTNPESIFDIDDGSNKDLILEDEQRIPRGEDESHSDDEEECIPQFFTHPFKGRIIVKDFKTAMEVYGICASRNSPHADAWFEFAMRMPDARKIFDSY